MEKKFTSTGEGGARVSIITMELSLNTYAYKTSVKQKTTTKHENARHTVEQWEIS